MTEPTQAELDTQRDQLIEAARLTTDYANANPDDAEAQAMANLAGDTALSARRLADRLRYSH